MTSLLDKISKVAVSSVLNNDGKNYGKKFMLDDDDETCWNSHQGQPQKIIIEFKEEIEDIKTLKIMFQGGFAGKKCEIQKNKQDDEKSFELHSFFYPDDSNKYQEFQMENLKNIFMEE
eukprot:gene3752-6640_t